MQNNEDPAVTNSRFRTDSRSSNQDRAIEHIKLSRTKVPTSLDWKSLSKKSKLSTADILYVILHLFDKKNSARPLPSKYEFLSEIYLGLDSANLIPDIPGIFDWMRAQGYMLTDPPTGAPRRRITQTTEDRNLALQKSAERLARKWVKAGRRRFSKQEIAKELACSEEWKDELATTIERIIRVAW